MLVEVLDEKHAVIVHYNAKQAYDSFMIFPESIVYFINYLVIIGSLLKFGLLVAARVRKQKLYVDVVGENVQHLDYFPNQKVFSVDEIMKRAELNLGKNEYNMFTNNCETLINWIIVGKRASNQGMTAVTYAVVLFLAVAALIVAML
jgi:hypothetical protein